MNDKIPKSVFVLLSDGDGTMTSGDDPFGAAVTTEEEAKRFVSEGKFGYSHSYMELKIFDNKDDAIKWYLGKWKKCIKAIK